MGKYDEMLPVRGSALQQLAAFFHQDFGMLFSSFDIGMSEYISGLRPEQRAALREDLRAVLLNAQTESQVRQAWIQAGAQWMAKEVRLREALTKLMADL